MGKSRGFKLLWVVLVGVSCFALGYTLRPNPSRPGLMRGSAPARFGSVPQRHAPPLRVMPRR